MTLCARSLLLVAATLILFERAMGSDENSRKLAITDSSQVDGDFALQGEYAGEIVGVDACGRRSQYRVGLQVVALGDGKFSAVQYWGGLPGGGWYGGRAARWQGQRRGDVLLLRSPTSTLTVYSGRALVASAGGRAIGQLPKMHRSSSTLGAAPPDGACVLFDGTNTKYFKNGKMTGEGLLEVGTELKHTFRDYTLHIEFRLPYMPHARGQGRANSGVYLQSRYELQILDSFGLEGEFNECGAIYRYRRPDLNMCLPPLRWQTYDIHFQSPRFDLCGRKLCPARVTVWHNGIVIHNNVAVCRKTGAGKPERPWLLPTKLQDHGNPVHFRNLWLVEHATSHQMIAAAGHVDSSLLRRAKLTRRPRLLFR